MTYRFRTIILVGATLLSAMLVASCGSSGSDAGSATTTEAAPAETTAPSETSSVDPTTDATTTTETGTSTTGAVGAGAVDCQALLQEYADRFTMDDLSDAAAFFRENAPEMPADVGDAVLRIADAYEAAGGDPANLDFGDVDLTADAQSFTDWTNDGCPAG